jgi:hypothetical protein
MGRMRANPLVADKVEGSKGLAYFAATTMIST